MKRNIFFALSFVFFAGCQKTVKLNLNSVPPQLVIEGQVTNTPGPYTVTISRSVNFYADNTFPGVSGASVSISDGEGVTDSLTETSTGNYTTHVLAGKPGNTYTLSVRLNDTTYTATSTMPQPVGLDSVTFDNGIGGRNQIRAQVNFQDPPGIKNYYQFILFIDGSQFTKDYFIFDDRLSDGRYITQNLRMDSSYLSKGQQLRVDMQCIDVNVYNYFNQLAQATSTGTFNTTTAPANPSTNISNGAYGYFSAHTISTQTVTVY
jgi:hypothetical protein